MTDPELVGEDDQAETEGPEKEPKELPATKEKEETGADHYDDFRMHQWYLARITHRELLR